jgi:hypothetical protein
MENIPPKTLARIETLARLMDDQFELFGFRFGLNFIIDLIPEIGDIITTMIALYIFGVAMQYKISKWVMARMLLNIAIYFIVGLIPWLGDLFGVWWKPNRRNLQLLQTALAKK